MILLIGYGNTLRRDDGAGHVLAHMIAERWEQKGLRVITAHQLAPEFAQELADPEVSAVIFMDASVENTADDVAGLPRRIDGVSDPGPTGRPVLGHHFPPEELLAYAKMLYDADIPAWLVTIPGTDFGFGETLSDATAKRLPTFAEKVLDLLRSLHDNPTV